MKLKNFAALLVAFTIAFAVFAPVSVQASDVVWQLTEWVSDLGLSVGDEPPQGDDADNGGVIVDAGATITVAANNGLFVDIGGNNWGAGVDIMVHEGALGIQEGDTVTVTFSADGHADGSVFRLSPYQRNWDAAGSPGLLNRTTLTGAGQEATMEVTVSEVTDRDGRVVRFGGAWAEPNTNVNFTITEIIVTRGAGAVVAVADDTQDADDTEEADDHQEPDDTEEEDIPAPTPRETPADVRELRFTIDSTTFSDDGTSRTLEAAPFIDDGRTMVPLRVIAEAFGAENLAMEDNTVTFELDGRDFSLPIGQYIAGVGTPQIQAGRTFVPLRFVIDELDADWYWDAGARVAYIYVG